MAKIGFDDYMLTHTKEEFEALPRLELEEAFSEEDIQAYWDWIENQNGTSDSATRFRNRRRDDIGNGERFIDQHGDGVRWSVQFGLSLALPPAARDTSRRRR